MSRLGSHLRRSGASGLAGVRHVVDVPVDDAACVARDPVAEAIGPITKVDAYVPHEDGGPARDMSWSSAVFGTVGMVLTPVVGAKGQAAQDDAIIRGVIDGAADIGTEFGWCRAVC